MKRVAIFTLSVALVASFSSFSYAARITAAEYKSCTARVTGGTVRTFKSEYRKWPLKGGTTWTGYVLHVAGQTFLKGEGADLVYSLDDGKYRMRGAFKRPSKGKKTSGKITGAFPGTWECRWK